MAVIPPSRKVTDCNLLKALIIMSCLVIFACSGHHVHHVVKRGDTLYAIGVKYDRDYRDLARWNNLHSPYRLQIGQVVRVAPPLSRRPLSEDLYVDTSTTQGEAATKTPVTQKPVGTPVPKPVLPSPKPASPPAKREVVATTAPGTSTPPPRPVALPSSSQPMPKVLTWQWPAQGRVLSRFNGKSQGKKGIAIGGKRGQIIRAAASGRVVYSGSGLRGYGKLLIIKHNEEYLSAYAHNSALHVNEGHHVSVGQHIADMGSSESDAVKLHFEIRRNGKPVDPLRYLPKN